MDFNQLYAEFAPWLNLIIITVGGTGIGTLIAKIIGRVKRELTEIRAKADMAEIFKAALPKDFTVKIEALAKTEMNKLLAGIRAEFITPIEELIKLSRSTAKALGSLRSVPDDVKAELSEQIEQEIKTVESLKIQLEPETAKMIEEKEAYLPEEL